MVACVFVMRLHTYLHACRRYTFSYISRAGEALGTCADLLSAARVCVEGYVDAYRKNSRGREKYAHFLGSMAWVLLVLFSLLLAPLVERAGVFSTRWPCFARGNSAYSAFLTRFAMSALSKEWGLYVSDFTWVQSESCNIRINVQFPNMETISARVLYLHCTHMYTRVAHSFPLCTPAYYMQIPC